MKKIIPFILFMFCCICSNAALTTDVLTPDNIGISKTTQYSTYTYTGPSGAQYRLQCAGDKNSIQIRSANENSGIVVTKSAGRIVSVSVEWNDETIDSRILYVYSSDSPFTDPSELYGKGFSDVEIKRAQGDQTHTFSNPPAYIGMRSYTGAMYITSIRIVWDSDNSSNPSNPSNPSDNTLTVSEAINRIQNGYEGQATVTGYVSRVTNFNTTYNSITYWISDTGSQTNEMQVYSGLGLNNKKFSSINDIKVGAKVVVTGRVKLYNNIPEFDINSYLLEYSDPNADIPASSITLNKNTLALKIGDTETLIPTVSPSNATNKTVTWSSSNSSVASVDSNGKVTALKEGNATITAKTGSVSATCSVTVTQKIIESTKIELNYSDLDLIVGDSFQLKATVSPSNVTDKSVIWSSSDRSVATVDNSGNVRALKDGTTVITAKNGNVSATCNVEVSSILSTYLEIVPSLVMMDEGKHYYLSVVIRPENTTDKTVIWSSSDRSVLTVDDEGVISAIKPGEATVTAKNGFISATCDVIVNEVIIDVTSVKLDKTSLTLVTGESSRLIATVSPSNATDKTVKWSTSNGSVASVDNNGNVKALSPGSATITAKSGNFSASCQVKVNPKSFVVDGITYYYEDNSSEVTVGEGSYGSLTYLHIPSQVTYASKTYTVTNIVGGAFKNKTNLLEVILPPTIKSVGSQAFEGCNSLKKVAFPSSVSNPFSRGTAISYDPNDCVIQNGIIYNNSKSKINYVSIKTNGAFEISSPISEISSKAFYACSEITKLTIGGALFKIYSSAFEQCTGLKYIKIDDLTHWCRMIFENSTANPLYYAQKLVVDDVEITDLNLPENIAYVEDFAFINASYLKSITIPKNISRIGNYAFNGCSRLNTVTAYPTTPPKITSTTFSEYTATLFVAEETEQKYRTADYWKNFSKVEYTSVIYLGIKGFNRELTSKSIGILDPSTVNDYTDWVNDLTLNPNTLLYYAVEQGVNSITSGSYKNKLSNAVLITFTDGLDQGSLALNTNFKTDQEYASYLSNKIQQARVQDVRLQAYAIGVKGTDVNDDSLFLTNLNSLSSKSQNVHQISSMAQIDREFDAIYDDIVQQKDQLILTISVPFMSDGVVCRFTFDKASSAENSKIWAQGTFNRNNMRLENVTYHGFSSSSGSTVKGTQNGLNISFTFEDCRDEYGSIMYLEDKSLIDHWTYISSNSKWQHNVEMGDNDVELEKRNSTAVMMLIDSSSSLGTDDFSKIKRTANTFIERLINYKGKYNTGINDIVAEEDRERPMDIYTIQGICIKRNATNDDINELPRGLYIIGGRKIFKQ